MLGDECPSGGEPVEGGREDGWEDRRVGPPSQGGESVRGSGEDEWEGRWVQAIGGWSADGRRVGAVLFFGSLLGMVGGVSLPWLEVGGAQEEGQAGYDREGFDN